ncbi:MAG TPA: ArsA-related P-loop ATPase [Acidimicrobiales bacterium]|nr:ArsA-related P-loop ATPase [Acidimicrobiales bacterium]
MRLAFVGKGGAGKSAISGTFARTLARQGDHVLAIDSDPLPGLAYSLGLPIDDTPPIPEDAVVERKEGEEGPRWRLNPDVDPLEAVEKWSVEAPDGVRFLQFGKIKGDTRALWRSQIAFRFIVNRLPAGHWNVVGDLPGGTRQAFTGWGNWATTVLVVVEPTAKSLLSGRRLARMADLDPEVPKKVMAVASKVTEPGDVDMIAKGTGLEVVAAVPYDEALAEAERRQLAPIDFAPDSPAVRAVESLVERLSEERVS